MNETLPDVSEYEKELTSLQKEINQEQSKLNGLDKGFESAMHRTIARIRDLEDLIAKGHEYHFVGKVGEFYPIKPGKYGGVLLREKDGKYYAATGSKGYRWLESEMVKILNKEDDIDRRFHAAMVDDAIATIEKYGDFERFVSDEKNYCPDPTHQNCPNCPNWIHTENKPNTCKLGYDCVPF
jgi:hypothetical protein